MNNNDTIQVFYQLYFTAEKDRHYCRSL